MRYFSFYFQIQSEKCPQKRKSHEENNKTDIEEDDDNKDNNFDEIEIEEGEIYSNDENLCDNQSYYNTNKTNVNDLRNNSDTESQYRGTKNQFSRKKSIKYGERKIIYLF